MFEIWQASFFFLYSTRRLFLGSYLDPNQKFNDLVCSPTVINIPINIFSQVFLAVSCHEWHDEGKYIDIDLLSLYAAHLACLTVTLNAGPLLFAL